MAEVFVHHSHLYPDPRGRTTGAPRGNSGGIRGWTADTGRAEGDILAISQYRIAAGARIAGKRWRLTIAGDLFKVAGRLPG